MQNSLYSKLTLFRFPITTILFAIICQSVLQTPGWQIDISLLGSQRRQKYGAVRYWISHGNRFRTRRVSVKAISGDSWVKKMWGWRKSFAWISVVPLLSSFLPLLWTIFFHFSFQYYRWTLFFFKKKSKKNLKKIEKY